MVNKQQKKKGKNEKKKYKIWFSGIGIVLMAIVIVVMVIFNPGKERIEAEDIPEELQQYELTGNLEKVRASLISLMGSPTGEFIYVYEPGCDDCARMNSLIFPLAEDRDITVHRLNLNEYPELEELLDLENITIPATIYFSRGYQIGWILSSEEDKYYEEFFDHFHHHYETHPEGEPGYDEQKGGEEAEDQINDEAKHDHSPE
ncbi:hypothetical protein [Gracilibacillus lacisalsi]|uniref:hypothetical protein n=1 Tax=Gracilibacillus lacisalsi TaxID=393087 RepID=UPI00037C442F|nr:hypothetical protein [Gracilibacillus lacisalsi]